MECFGTCVDYVVSLFGKQYEVVVVNTSSSFDGEWKKSNGTVVRWRNLINGDFMHTKDLVIGEALIAPNSPVEGSHSHNSPEAYYILAGKAVLVCNGNMRCLIQGDCVWIPEGISHHCYNDSKTEDLRILYIFPRTNFSDIVYKRPNIQ
jgi:mannose-6-phosphate isomerase-like protein (cupin superfamily)